MEPRRFSGKTVDEATDNALEALDVNREDVEIVVVNPGRSGILGFGGEPAEIEVTLLEGQRPAVRDEPEREDAGGFDDDDFDDQDEPGEYDGDDFDDESEPPAQPAPTAPAIRSTGGEPTEGRPGGDYAGEPGEPQRERQPRERPSEPDPEVIEFASEVIDYFLASMNVVADTYIRDETDDGVPVFDIEGEDSGLLIGRRGETLQSLQYLVNLIVANQLGRSAFVQIDIEGYKERRRETLAAVARRTAERVLDTGEPVELEPMPAYERRWIHMALADSTDVRTESSGEGPERFVVVYPQHEGTRPDRPRGRGGRRRRR